jgi:alpha-L-fucosidase 2
MRNRTHPPVPTRRLLAAGLAFVAAAGGLGLRAVPAPASHPWAEAETRATQERAALELRYSEPARRFEESILLGNGRIGASVFGGVDAETIHLNDATLWSGRPVDPFMAPEAHRNLPAVREALAAKDWERADRLVRSLQGSFSQSFAPLGTLSLEMDTDGEASSYERKLSLRDAEASTRYRIGTTDFVRRSFVSSPDSVLVVRLDGSDRGALSFRIRFESLLRYRVRTEAGALVIDGEAPVDAEPDYLGDVPDPIVYEEGRGTRFAVHVRIADTDGLVTETGATLRLTRASRATILVSVATSFAGFDREPGTGRVGRTKPPRVAWQPQGAARSRISALATSRLRGLLRSRISRPGAGSVPGMTTDRRLLRYADGSADPYLEALCFQFGRYLLISSSRTPGVPATLQGIWNPPRSPRGVATTRPTSTSDELLARRSPTCRRCTGPCSRSSPTSRKREG